MIPLIITLISLLVGFVVYKMVNYSIRKPHLKNIYDSYNECHKYIEKFQNFEFENISADVPKEISYGIFCTPSSIIAKLFQNIKNCRTTI